MKDNFVIGVLGMGTYATILMFRQYAEIFEAEKEWDRPRIVIDNRCTMPSRVRAFLYNENVEKLLSEMIESLDFLVNAGCTHIVLACNTAHLFLPMILERRPEFSDKVLNIVDNCVNRILEDGKKQVYLIGTEGTVASKVYQSKLSVYDIDCLTPEEDEYSKMRFCIEAVKQNKFDDEVKRTFLELVNRTDTCILGCTELPVLFEKYGDEVTCKTVYDPMRMAVERLKEIYNEN